MAGMRRIELKEALSLCGELPVKYAALVAIGVTTGCRISEITALRRRDLIDERGNFREEIAFLRLKSRRGPKTRRASIPEAWRIFVIRLLEAESERGRSKPDDYVFRGKNGRPLSRLAAYRYFRERLGAGHGTHWMRKTFAYEMFRCFMSRYATDPLRALDLTRRTLGHEQIQTTICYLGIDECEIAEVQKEVFNTMGKR